MKEKKESSNKDNKSDSEKSDDATNVIDFDKNFEKSIRFFVIIFILVKRTKQFKF